MIDLEDQGKDCFSIKFLLPGIRYRGEYRQEAFLTNNIK